MNTVYSGTYECAACMQTDMVHFARRFRTPEKSGPRHPYPAFTILANRTVSGFQEKAA